MRRAIFGPIAVISIQVIGAWPGFKRIPFRLSVWLFMLFTIVCQFRELADYQHYAISALMEIIAVTTTNVLSLVKFAILWNKKGYLEKYLDMVEEDWKKMRSEKYLAIMSRAAKNARTVYIVIAICYYAPVGAFVIDALLRYTPEDPINFEKRELLLKASYPFDVFHTPIFEIVQGVGIIQAILLATGNGLGDGLLFLLTTHVNGQLDILHDRLLQLSDVAELPVIIRQHQRIIHLAEIIEVTFKWIALFEFVSVSVIVCAVGYVLVTALESNNDSLTIAKLTAYICAMQFGSFVYCHVGNVLTEKTLNIRQAAYESGWADLPPETTKVLIIIMMRADIPLSLTAGGFCNMNYESWVNISKTAASYLSVIRASSE